MDEAAAPLELCVLGTTELRAPGAGQIVPVLAQPKRLALLCYLALGGPGGFQRRDTLLALFWPELDTARGRAALSQALHFLRHHLGPGVVVGRGGEEVGLEAGRLRCDVVELEAALDRDAAADALALYHGDLLPGFFISEALDFERWLEGERSRLRARVVDAALGLSAQRAAAGMTEEAVRWARWAMAQAPADEAAVRCLAHALDCAGDRAGALRALDGFKRWLEAEFGAPPAQETSLLAERLRSGSAAPIAASVSSPASPVPAAVTPAPAPADRLGPAPRSMAGRATAPRALLTSASVLLLLLLLVAGALGAAQAASRVWRQGGRDGMPVAGRTVLIFPFEYHGDAGLAYTAGAAAELLKAGLEGVDQIRTVGPRGVTGTAPSGRRDPSHREERSIAARFGARSYITGAVAETGGQLRLTSTWYHSDGQTKVSTTHAGEATTLFDLVDRTAAELLSGRVAGPAARLTRSAARTTESLRALRSFLEGERQFRAGRFGAASESFQHALAEDSAFALAHYRLSITAEYLGDQRLARHAAEAAVRHGAGLQPATRALLAALLATRRGEADRAEYLYRETLATQQYEVEAWFQLGEVLFHYGPAHGRPVQNSRRAWEAVLELEPDNVAALYHVARILALDGDRKALTTLADRMAEISPGHERVWAMRALESTTAGDPAVRRVVANLRHVDDATLYMAVFDAIAFGADPAATRHLARVMTDEARPPGVRAWGHLWLAHLEVALGRPRAATRELDRLAELDPLAATEYAALLALNPLLEPAPGTLQDLSARLRSATMVGPSTSPDFPGAIHPQLRPELHAYLHALIAARAGDGAALERTAASLEAAASPASPGAAMAAALRAVAASSAGLHAQAREYLESSRYRDWYEPARWSSFLSQSHERWLSAEVLEAMDRPREALAWYQSVPQNSPLDVVYLASAHLRRAALHEQLEEPDLAAHAYARFLELWHDCEPELHHVLRAAQDHLARIRPASTPTGG
jgi:DNA-binding SARP family transcriptional activator